MPFLGLSISLTGGLVAIALGVVYAMLIALVQRRMFDRELQAAMKQHQKELSAMIKGGSSKEEINAKQDILMQHFKKSMNQQLKFMIVVFPLLFIFYDFLLPALPLGASAMDKISVNLILFKWTFTQEGWLFIAFATIAGLVLSLIVSLIDRRTARKKQVLQQMGSVGV